MASTKLIYMLLFLGAKRLHVLLQINPSQENARTKGHLKKRSPGFSSIDISQRTACCKQVTVTTIYECCHDYDYVGQLSSVNLNRAIKLLDAVSDFQFKPSDKRPTIRICYEQKDDYALYIRKGEVSQNYRKHLEEIVKSNSLRMRESNEYLKIYDH